MEKPDTGVLQILAISKVVDEIFRSLTDVEGRIMFVQHAGRCYKKKTTRIHQWSISDLHE